MMARGSHAVAHGRSAEHRIAASGMSGMVLASIGIWRRGSGEGNGANRYGFQPRVPACPLFVVRKSGGEIVRASCGARGQRIVGPPMLRVLHLQARTPLMRTQALMPPSPDCYPQADGGEMCGSGCLASQYELLCTGVGPSFAPHPADAPQLQVQKGSRVRPPTCFTTAALALQTEVAKAFSRTNKVDRRGSTGSRRRDSTVRVDAERVVRRASGVC